VDEEEGGRGTPNSHAALLIPLSQSRLGWIGSCTARDAMDEWPKAVGESDRLCHGYRSIRHAKIYIFNLATFNCIQNFGENFKCRLPM
jgi:hypothetical protein